MRFVFASILSATIAFAAADTARGEGEGPTTGPVMEIVTFRLTAGTSDADFIRFAQGTKDMVAARPGFIRRSLLRDEDGVWTDTVEWQSLAQAQTAAETLMADAAFAPFGAAIDMNSMTMRHLPILWQMGD